MVLEQQKRYEISTRIMYIPKEVIKTLEYEYPGYELIFHAEAETWVLYHIKYRGGSPAGDLLCKQFELPIAETPGMWVIALMKKQDRKDENFKKWLEETRDYNDKFQASKQREKTARHKSSMRDLETYMMDEKKHFIGAKHR